MALLLFYLFLALIVSFLCSIMEAVLLSTPQSFLMVQEREWKKHARNMIKFKDDVEKPLSAILSLNTIAHTVWAAWVWAQAVEIFGEAYFWIVSAILTLLILVLTEIIPKTIWAKYWRHLTLVVSYLIRWTLFITYPLVILSTFITKIISRNGNSEVSTSREEISALAGIWADEWLLKEQEYKIIKNLLRLKNIKVTDIMTPRITVAMADEEISLKDFLKSKDYLKFSRIPVYSWKIENITWYVIRQKVFEKLAEDQNGLKLSDIKREIVVSSDEIMLFTLWERLLEEKEQIALIVDKYGWMEWIVTMEDIIETLLWLEIVDEKDTVADMQKYAQERWKTRQEKYNFLEKLKEEWN